MWDNTLTTATGRYDRAERGSATLPPAVRPGVSVCYCTDSLRCFFIKLQHILNSTTTHQPHPFTSLHHLCPPEPCLASGKTFIHFNILLLTHKAPHGPGPPFQPHGSYSISTSLKCNVLFTHLLEWQLRTQRWAVQRWKGSWRSGRFVSARDRVCHNQEEPPTSTSKKKKVN